MSGTVRPARASVRRRLPSIPYSAGVRNTVNIDRDGVLHMLAIRIAFTVANGATPPTGPLWQCLARLIRRLEVIVNGQDTVVSINGAHLASRAQLEWGVRALGMDAAVVLTANATTNYEIVLPLPFFLPRAVRPDDCSLDLRNVNQAVLAITWGDRSDLFATPGTAAISNVVCQVAGHYTVNVPAEAQPYLVRALDMQEASSGAANANFTVLQDRGQEILWRSWHIASLRNNVSALDIITGDVRLYSGAFVYSSREAVEVLAETARAAMIPWTEYPAADRVYRLDMPTFGSNTTVINGGALSGDLYLSFGLSYTSGTELLSISREAMRLLRG